MAHVAIIISSHAYIIIVGDGNSEISLLSLVDPNPQSTDIELENIVCFYIFSLVPIYFHERAASLLYKKKESTQYPLSSYN